MEAAEEEAMEAWAQLERDMDGSHLPRVWLTGRAGLREAIEPREGDDARRLCDVYEMVARVQAQSESEDHRAACSGSGPVPPSCGSGSGTVNVNVNDEGPVPPSCGSGSGTVNVSVNDEDHRAARSGSGPKKGKEEPTKRVGEGLQRRMLGYLVNKVRHAQKYVEERAYEIEGKLPAKSIRLIARVNQMVTPWIRAIARIVEHETLRRLDEWWTREGLPEQDTLGKASVVYARVTLKSTELYIGETDNWMKRQYDHSYKTFRHGGRCANPCRRCAEHVNYIKHRTARVHEWVMIPLATTRNKQEAKQLETLLQRKWTPALNSKYTAPWLAKDSYAKDLKHRTTGTRTPPWKAGRILKPKGGAMMTTYTSEEVKSFNLGYFVERYPGGFRATVKPGAFDLTDWRELRFTYGESYVRIQRKNGERIATVLKKWRPREEEAHTECAIFVIPKKAKLVDKEEIQKEITGKMDHLERMSENELEFAWRTRAAVEKYSEVKYSRMVEEECHRRYGCRMGGTEISLPYIEKIDARELRQTVVKRIQAQNYPEWIKNWLAQKVKITTKGQPSIGDILSNVTKPGKMNTKCCCKEVLRHFPNAPKTEGHVLFVGRDMEATTLNVCAKNIPRQTWFDTFKVWENVNKQLPESWRMETGEWKKELFKVLKKEPKRNVSEECEECDMPNTKEVYTTRMKLRGMVIGPLDKNTGELWGACPILYHRAMRKAYSREAGYDTVFPAKLSQYRKKRYSTEELPGQILRELPVPCNQQGEARDIVEMYKRIYKRRGWEAYAKFDNKGGFNVPYILFKAKNMIDMEVRKKKWMKARPIAPGTKHPMKRLLHYVGRAWSFVVSRMEGNHFVINKTDEVPNFLREAEANLRDQGQLSAGIWDVVGCYPSMPKETIRFAMRWVAGEMRRTKQVEGVYVPKYSDTQPCMWKSGRRGMQFIPFEVMMDVMEFSLDYAIIQMPSGELKKQREGIPMGDPISPAMAIAACAWMEHEWMESLTLADKGRFRAKRFMDDILMIYARNESWDHEKFIKDFERSECYQEPLELEMGKDGTFLETRYEIRGNAIKYKLKNENETGETKVWRYQHFHSASPFMQKRATLTACLRKVQRMSSDPSTLWESALDKVAEFRRLRYPLSVLRKACSYLGATSGEGTWITVRNTLR